MFAMTGSFGEKKEERVNHPSHYNIGIEVLEFIVSWNMDFVAGNVIKYVCRAPYKGNTLQDLQKAKFYLDKEIKLIEDCLIEIKVYEKLLGDLPEYTREQFEAAELEYWKTRLLGDARRNILSTILLHISILTSLGNQSMQK